MSGKKVLVVVGHPDVANSFNGAIARVASEALVAQGYEPVLRDLYAEGFDPVMPLDETNRPVDEAPEAIRAEMEQVKECVGMVFVHPNWWGTPPAILKGWIDRVVRNGFAYGFTEQGPWQGLSDKIVQVFTTSNTPRDYELEVYGDPLENFWKTIVFSLVGSKSFERRNFEQIILSDEKTRAEWLAEVDATIRRRFV
ncbi:MAG: NAD(P)H-dependent oxidoreductase [Thermoguttaceae bacterium]|nr:NAD(P)H-dependent oxidoreductase [Thermoguttaceae bacterium]MBR5760321.1 NAD(P)H-dependent oxidoreductase [Thermoguttaceae bacterium]